MDQLQKIFQKEFHELSEIERGEILDLCANEREFEEVKQFYTSIDQILMEEVPPVEMSTKKSLDALFVEKHKEKSILWYNSMLTVIFTKEKKWHEQTIVRIAAVLLLVFSVFPFLRNAPKFENKQIAQVEQKNSTKVKDTETKNADVTPENSVEIKSTELSVETKTAKVKQAEPVLIASIDMKFSSVEKEELHNKNGASSVIATKAFSMQEHAELFDLLSPTF